jgi:hypothetical protein
MARGIRVLLVHALPLDRQGGAEISLRHHVEHAPARVQLDLILPTETPDLEQYDAVVLGNLRPEGGLGEDAEVAWIRKWTTLCQNYSGFSLKSERDIHACAQRDARCIAVDPVEKVPCTCGPRIPRAVEDLYNSCSAVQFLSPAHREVVQQLVQIRSRQVVIAAPVEATRFGVTTPPAQRPPKALILGDSIRVAPTAVERAKRAGLQPECLDYQSVPYEEMPELLNRFRAIILDPVMFHAFGRLAVEGQLCGCEILASPRVGAFSWKNPVAAAVRSNRDFWRLLLNQTSILRTSLRRLKGRIHY